MIASICVIASACLGVDFDVLTIPLEHRDANVFAAQLEAGAAADVFVLDGYSLTPYSGATGQPMPAIRLADGTTAFDIADTDGDGRSEVIAICVDRILRQLLPKEGAPPPPQDLFALHTELSANSIEPYPDVLVVQHEGRILLGLPTATAIELHALDGELVASYPTEVYKPEPGSNYKPFTTQTVEPSALGPRGAVERQMCRRVSSNAKLPKDLVPKFAGSMWSDRNYYRAVNAAREKPVNWPWFPLRMPGRNQGSESVLFALTWPSYQETQIRLRGTRPDWPLPKGTDARIGVERHYPGAPVTTREGLPDFNHDGFVDLLLWKSPMPGMTTDALMRALTSGAWRVDLTVHLYDPAKSRYDPVPATAISAYVPVLRFLNGYYSCPVQDCVLNDFDGDGRTDLGFSTGENAYSIWLYRDSGFPEKPDFQRAFPDRIHYDYYYGGGILVDLEGKGRTTIGLRSEKAMYLVKVRPAAK